MKENFLHLVKEIDMQVQEARRVPNKMDAKKTTPRCIIIRMPKVKNKEIILKAAREKQSVVGRYLQGISHKTVSRFLKRNFSG